MKSEQQLFDEIDAQVGIKPVPVATSTSTEEDALFSDLDSQLGIKPNVQPVMSDQDKVNTVMEHMKSTPSAVSARNAVQQLTPNIMDVPFIGDTLESAKSGIEKVGRGVKGLYGTITNSDVNTTEDVNANTVQAGRYGANITGGLLETIFSPITGALKGVASAPGIKQGLNAFNENVIQKPGSAIGENKGLQNFAMENPNAEEFIGDVSNTIGAFVGGNNAPKIKTAVNEGLETTGTGLNNITRKAQEMVSANDKAIENKIVSQYEKAVKPNLGGKSNPTQAAQYKNDIVSGVKSIKENQSLLKFTDEAGDVIEGRLPENPQQLTEALDQTKKSIFSKYDSLAKEAGEAGVKVKVDPIVSELDTVINNKALALTHPETVTFAKELQNRFKNIGELDTSITQEVIQNYNADLKTFYRNPSADNVSKMAISSLVVNQLRKGLDDAVTGITGKNYSALKRQYGALKSLERDIVKASLRDSRKNVKGLIDFSDILSGGQVTSGLISANPGLVMSGLTQKAIASYYKYLNSPSRAIKGMFNNVDTLATRAMKRSERLLKTNANMSQKYIQADGKALSKNAEAWIDKNEANLKDKEVLKELSDTSPKTYKEVREYLNSQGYLNKDKTLIERLKDTPNKQGGFAKNPFVRKNDTLIDKVSEAIDSISTDPVKVDGKLEFGNVDDAMELEKAKERINKNKPLTVEEAEAYVPVLKRNGIDVYAELDNAVSKVDDVDETILKEVNKFSNSRDFAEKLDNKAYNALREKGIRFSEDREKYWQEITGKTEKSYAMSHRPSKLGATGDDISKTEAIPSDFYEHPEWYANMNDKTYQESFRAIKLMKGKPNKEITIYRASPKNELNDGDWITLSKSYAKQESNVEKTPVHSFKVKAKDIQFAGDDINEFGYFPEKKD